MECIFCAQGVVHHFIGSLVPNSDESPAFVQIYIHDGTPEAEAENRQRHLGEAKLPELRDRVKNPSGLKIMVCGTDKTKSVSIKNVVYREIFDPHSQIEHKEDIKEVCSLFN